MKKTIQRFPIGTLVQATIPKVGSPPQVVVGLVISHVRNKRNVECCEVFLGPNNWLPHMQIVNITPGRLRSISRAYTKEKK